MSSASLVGRTIGKYEIRSLIGRGGMATVYLGYQAEIDRLVAVKVLPPHPGTWSEFIERFQLEARTVARLQHPHILPLYDYGNVDDILYFVTPYIEGGSLDRVIRAGRVAPLHIEHILQEVSSALDYAHRQDIIHRDIKPDNILMDTDGHALLADFGIAKITSSTSNLTGTAVVGTPAYMAPEQAQGDSDYRADIYSLGIVVFEMLTGKQPYRSENPVQVMVQQVTANTPSILSVAPDLPVSLEPVMLKVMAKSPEDRYQSATEFFNDFRRALHEGDSLARLQPISTAGVTLNLSTQPTVVQSPTNQTQPQTIIVHQSTASTRLLLAGFVLLSLLIAAGILMIASLPDPPSDEDELPNRTDEVIIIVPNTDGTPPGTPPNFVQAITATPEVPSFGELSFGKATNPGDTLSLRVNGIQPPTDGKVYVAWLLNTVDDTKLNLGRVVVDAVGNGALAYTDTDGRILPTLFNAVALSEETSADVATPSADIRYSAGFAPEVMTLLSELLVSSTNGWNNTGLLESALREARFAGQHAGLASGASNIGGVKTHAEHTINILNGTTVDHDGNGSGQNPGTGIGIYKMLDAIDTVVQKATGAETANQLTQTNAENIRVCVANVRVWSDQVVARESQFIAATDMESIRTSLDESTKLAEQLLSGVDQNENGTIEAFEGECGLQQIETYGILVASMTLREGDLVN